MVCTTEYQYAFVTIPLTGKTIKFRTAFTHMGELCSIIPAIVNVMALTAAATQVVFKKVVNVYHCNCLMMLTLLVKPFKTLNQFVTNLALSGYQKTES